MRRMRFPKQLSLFVSLLVFSVPLWAQEIVGRVAELNGKVLVLHAGEAKPAPLAVQAPVFLQDTIETRKKGSVKLSLKDGSDFILRENTKIVVTEFLFDPEKNRRQTVLNVALGRVRAVVTRTFDAAVSKTELKTPNAVVGVRGTDFAIEVTKKKTIVYCFEGLIRTFNPLYPERTVSLAAGMFTDVLVGMIPNIPNPIPPEMLQELEYQFGVPLTTEGWKQKGKEELRKRLPFPF